MEEKCKQCKHSKLSGYITRDGFYATTLKCCLGIHDKECKQFNKKEDKRKNDSTKT